MSGVFYIQITNNYCREGEKMCFSFCDRFMNETWRRNQVEMWKLNESNPFSWLNYTRGRKVNKPPATQTNPPIKQAFYAGICHLSLELQRLRVFVADFNSPASLTDPLIYLHQGKYTSLRTGSPPSSLWLLEVVNHRLWLHSDAQRSPLVFVT